MLYASLLLAASAFSGLVAAQNYSACCDINPGSVDPQLRQTWCRAEQNTCPELCGGIGNLANNGNLCDSNLLTYTCECKDGTKPNVTNYQQSLPAQMCLTWVEQCVNANPNDLIGITACRAITCGNKTLDSAASSSSAAASSTAAPSSTGKASGSASVTAASATSTTSKGAAAAATAMGLVKDFGTPVLAAGMMAVFGLAL
ncbi:hypothetical protein BU16DRAFT_524281 [Lophium mytilinum]|uniref:DUF7707 domain-containing protein n=1 Tax=Lophium mytilinum TaxID=390894 RepID=A0A6A6R5K6_9PEZI|nr:hypothetical protein BU16DRAFT_524281 [Lophium mytilinum]